MKRIYLTLATDEVSELSRPWTEVGSRGDRVEDTPSSITTLERQSVPSPVDLDTLPLHGKEHHKGGNGDTTRECGASDAERKQRLAKLGEREGTEHVLVVLRPPTEESPLNVVVEQPTNGDSGPNVRQVIRSPHGTTIQEGRDIKVPENLPRPAKKVERNREEGANEETPQEAVVDGTRTEHLLGPKGTPEDGRG